MIVISGYQIQKTLYEGTRSVVYRGHRESDQKPVVLKMLNKAYPTPTDLARFKLEYEITKDLNLDEVVKPYALESYDRSLVIIKEDFGGSSLTELMQTHSFTVEDILKIAIQLAEGLGQIHNQNIIHKDINPANIIFNPETGKVKITDFGISTVLSRENPQARTPEVLEGTLAYMSPEQTGRMNRAVDYRTDFYSLGITLYELLTGQLPFQTTDAMALVHAHIARQPSSPVTLRSETPPILAKIILKLLAKTAEARYQSAAGLKADLETCLKDMQMTGRIEDFPLGQLDHISRFQLPQKLYGREMEIEQLMNAFERVSEGRTELVLVSGYAGIGKSSLINEIHKPITRQRGYFISGKFDQYNRNTPYASLAQAFQQLIRQILSESEVQFTRWKEELLKALGPNGQIIIDLIPEVQLIIGPQPPAPSLSPAEAQNRFNLVFQNFVRAFSQKDHPLVIFLDDLQWADAPTLKLLDLLIDDPETPSLLLIGAYRDHEVSSADPLALMIAELQKRGTPLNQITLNPLGLDNIQELLDDTLNIALADSLDLARLVYNKTEGNPFFINEFLKSLYEDNLIAFDLKDGRWQWDPKQIQQAGITDNVVELMVDKIQRLSSQTQEALKLAACIGNRFDLQTLAVVRQAPQQKTAAELWQAIETGWIVPENEAYRFFRDADAETAASILDIVEVSYKFLHDRVQQAAYSLIPEAERAQIHLTIGRLMYQNTGAADLDDRLFDIVSHFNLSLALLDLSDERQDIAKLNLQAGQKAKTAAAYEPALRYLSTALDLLPADRWQSLYDLSLAVTGEAAEAAYLSTDFALADHLITDILKNAQGVLDKVRAYEVRIQAYMAQHKMLEAIDTAREVLALLEIKLPKNPNTLHILMGFIGTKLTLGRKGVAELREFPEMEDAHKLAAMRILMITTAPAYFAEPNTFPLIVFHMVNLSVKHGTAPASAYGYGTYGVLLCAAFGDIKTGHAFGEFGLELLDRFQAQDLRSKILVVFNTSVRHWRGHTAETLAPLREGYQSGLETGDLEYAAIAAFVYGLHAYLTGQDLRTLEAEMAHYSEALARFKQERSLRNNQLFHQAVLNLMGQATDPTRLIGGSFDEKAILPQFIEASDESSLNIIHLYTLQLSYLFGNLDQALERATLSEQYAQANIGTSHIPTLNFYQSLTLLGKYPEVSKREQTQFLKKVKTNQKKMKKWGESSPANYQHKYRLVEAENHRVLGQDGLARESYDQAIALARQANYLNDEALANELAARFYLDKAQPRQAKIYLQDAHYAYQRWGAMAKVVELEERYADYFTVDETSVEITTTTTSTSSTKTGQRRSNELDLISVVKASQAISGEILLDKLLTTLMRLVIENAGAEQGYLIFEADEVEADEVSAQPALRWVIEAAGSVEQTEISVLQAIPVESDSGPRLPLSILNYVAHTLEDVVLHDATHEGRFTRDAYIRSRTPKSILCTPFINQGKLVGLLYLENNLVSGAFTPDRLDVLNLLSAQAAISIENARLYQERLQLSAIQRELSIAKNIQHSLLPHARPDWAALDVVCYSASAREVGGDFYTYHVIQDDPSLEQPEAQTRDKFSVVVGDVTGKGMPAALLMAVSLASFQAVVEQGLPPSDLLSYLDQVIQPYSNTTLQNCALVYIEIQAGQLTAGNAGCIPPLIRRGADNQVEWIDVKGVPLGLGLGSQLGYEPQSITLSKGDMIILTSDGVVEANNQADQLFGFERLEEVVKMGPTSNAQEMLEHLKRSVNAFAGSAEQHDDITIVVIQA